ncbi:MAG: hypothetical protein KTR28_09270 [Micavibrio sp.]|nr:hypothetical protein [Micavibrio sp.]
MNIDLLFTANGDAGLILSQTLPQKAIGIVFDFETGLFTIEYADMDYLELNIPVQSDFYATLDATRHLHLGSIVKSQIAQAYQVPIMFMDDPYRMEALNNTPPIKSPLAAFEAFMKSCVFGQPVHRGDLADEGSSSCILGDSAPSSLQFAPHLARARNLESAPRAAPSIGPSGPGLGGGSASHHTSRITRQSSDKNSNED